MAHIDLPGEKMPSRVTPSGIRVYGDIAVAQRRLTTLLLSVEHEEAITQRWEQQSVDVLAARDATAKRLEAINGR